MELSLGHVIGYVRTVAEAGCVAVVTGQAVVEYAKAEEALFPPAMEISTPVRCACKRACVNIARAVGIVCVRH